MEQSSHDIDDENGKLEEERQLKRDVLRIKNEVSLMKKLKEDAIRKKAAASAREREEEEKEAAKSMERQKEEMAKDMARNAEEAEEAKGQEEKRK